MGINTTIVSNENPIFTARLVVTEKIKTGDNYYTIDIIDHTTGNLTIMYQDWLGYLPKTWVYA